jgi:hypothetical protein
MRPASITPGGAGMGDAAHLIFTQDARAFTGRFCIDDTLLYEHGVKDFEKYRVDPSVELAPDAGCTSWIPGRCRAR